MAEQTTFGYKKVFGIILPDWVTEKMIKMVAGGFLVTMAMMFVLLFVINPQRDQIKELSSKLKADQVSVEFLRQSRDSIVRLTNELSEKEMENVMLAMPGEYSPERAIFVLRQVAADTGVSIVSYSLPAGIIADSSGQKSVKASTRMVDFSSYVIKLTVSAPVDLILSFVAKIESSLPLGVVSDLNLQEVTKMTRVDAGKSIQMSLELKYFQPNLNAININKIEAVTDKNLENARKLTGYNTFSLPGENNAVAEATYSGTLFGF